MVGYDRKYGKFRVGARDHNPVVSADDLRQHLCLLAAFADLRRRASQESTQQNDDPPAYSATERIHPTSQSSPSPPPPGSFPTTDSADPCSNPPAFDDNTTSSSLWNTFLIMALHRFEVYLEKVLTPTNLCQDGIRPRFRKLMLPANLAGLSHDRFVELDNTPEPSPIEIPESLLPPLDVALIWHSYMLNPSRYIEDCHRLPSRYVLLRVPFPLRKLAGRLATGSGARLLANEARAKWQALTGLAFDLFNDADDVTEGAPRSPFLSQATRSFSDQGVAIRCPNAKCKLQQPHILSWTVAAQPHWSVDCPSCKLRICKEILLGKGFLDDLDVWRYRGSDTHGWRMRGGILSRSNGHTFHKDPYNPILYRLVQNNRKLSGTNEDVQGRPISNAAIDVYGMLQQGKASSASKAFKDHQPDITQIASKLGEMLLPGLDKAKQENLQKRLRLLMSYYIDSHPLSPASLDLVAAVQRQFRFIEEMESLGWLSGPFPYSQSRVTFDKDAQETIDNAIIRYHGWLNLSARHPDTFVSPTLDIDLAWHTHQLDPHYYTDCYRLLGRFLDHDDKVEKLQLGAAFQNTADLWSRLYHQPYSWCGCAEHRQNFAMAKRLFAKLKGKGKAIEEVDKGVDDGASEATTEEAMPSHPSAHNAFQVGFDPTAGEEKKNNKKKDEPMDVKGPRGKLQSVVSNSSSGSNRGKREEEQLRSAHDNPFRRDYAHMAPFMFFVAPGEGGNTLDTSMECNVKTLGKGSCLGGQAITSDQQRFKRVTSEANTYGTNGSGYIGDNGAFLMTMPYVISGSCGVGGNGGCGGGGGGGGCGGSGS